jgi:hypothetical protein
MFNLEILKEKILMYIQFKKLYPYIKTTRVFSIICHNYVLDLTAFFVPVDLRELTPTGGAVT